MAYEVPVLTRSFIAGSDLSTRKYYLVKLSGVDTVDYCITGSDKPIGILQNAPSVNENAEVMLFGITKVYCASAVGIGSLVASNTTGQATDVVVTGSYYCAQLLQSGTTGTYAAAVILGVPVKLHD